MNKEFVTYEQALALKELGFDEPCFGVYSEYDKTRVYDESAIREGLKIQTPLYQQAFRWFREKYKLHSYIHSDYSWNISGGIWDLGEHKGSRYDWDSDTYTTYEESEEVCLNKLIEIIKNNG